MSLGLPPTADTHQRGCHFRSVPLQSSTTSKLLYSIDATVGRASLESGGVNLGRSVVIKDTPWKLRVQKSHGAERINETGALIGQHERIGIVDIVDIESRLHFGELRRRDTRSLFQSSRA